MVKVENRRRLNIIVLESDESVLMRIEHVLSDVSDIHIIGKASTKRQAQELMAQFPFQMLVTDLSLPDGLSLELIRQCAAAHPDCDIMLLINSGDNPHIVSAIESGAKGYVIKDELEKNLIAAVRLLQAGGSPVSPGVAKSVLRALRTQVTQVTTVNQVTTPNPLSERETEILNLLAKGMSFNEIGEILTISPHTVTAHVKKIYRKLQVHSRGEAVYEAAQMGLFR